jgi:N-acetylglutamate synthase-like GNAT family acetyltransferase
VDTSKFQLRRATSDDLRALVAVWREVGLAPADLEPSFTEFQLVVGPEGELAAAIALKIHQGNGLLHSECLPDFSLAERLRPLLWQRILQVATNHGLNRIWTQESAPFWKQLEFVQPDGGQIAALPDAFRIKAGAWQVLPLKSEEDLKRVDREFEVFLQRGRAKAEEMKSQGRLLYWIAILIALSLFVFVLIGAFRTMSRNKTQGRGPVPTTQEPAVVAHANRSSAA